MMRWICGCLIILIVVWPSTPVAACSMVEQTLDMLTQQADLIVVATVSNVDNSQAFFTVDSAIKGAVTNEPLSVLNHSIELGAMCELLLGDGNRFAVGSTWVLFLRPNQTEATAIWQPMSFGNYGIYEVVNDEVSYTENNQEQTLALADLVSTLNNYSMAGAATVTALPAGQTAEPKGNNTRPTATFEAPPIGLAPQITEQPPTQTSIMPWILVGIGVLAATGAWVGWRRSHTN